jgi:hypothetical protein
VFIAPCFDHREDDWEAFLMVIIIENEKRHPNYTHIQNWFVDKFEKALNHTETKSLCRYVKMSSMAKDRDTKLRDSMDMIDLPPIQYDGWVNEVYTLEYDELESSKDAEPRPSSRNYVKDALDSIRVKIASIIPKPSETKTHPTTITRSNSKLSLSNPNKSAKRSKKRNSTTLEDKKTDIDASSTGTETDGTDKSNVEGERRSLTMTRKFSSQEVFKPRLVKEQAMLH